ncbi:Uncharacterized mitochondrial protein AtMg00310 [Linum grandiflorum]
MLVKQGWQFLSDPNVLVSQVFKAKYFLKGDFLSAKLGYRPSYVWRSINAAQEMVRDGCHWRIGDGHTAKVFGEPWLRDEHNCWVKPVPSLQLDDLTVYDLLIPNLRVWDNHLLISLFSDRDIQVIQSMAPPEGDAPDTLIWRFERKGIYTVRSAYRGVTSQNPRLVGLQEPSEWMQIWRMQLQLKTKQML